MPSPRSVPSHPSTSAHTSHKRPMAPAGVKIFNPAFDVTDHSLISGIVTEYGVIRPPYQENLAALAKGLGPGKAVGADEE